MIVASEMMTRKAAFAKARELRKAGIEAQAEVGATEGFVLAQDDDGSKVAQLGWRDALTQ